MNLDCDAHPVEHILFGPEARIQSVQTTDRGLEERFGLNLGSVFDSQAVHKINDAVPLEHLKRPRNGLGRGEIGSLTPFVPELPERFPAHEAPRPKAEAQATTLAVRNFS